MTTSPGTATPDIIEMGKHSPLEQSLWVQMADINTGVRPLPFWHRHVYGHECDFVFSGERIIVEVQGGTWKRGGGAHNRAEGYAADRMRANHYQLNGWMVLEFTADHVNDGSALEMIREALEERMYDDEEMDR